jgi:hypothetical protein
MHGFMGLGGYVVFVGMCGLASLGTRLKICPRWLRQFRIEKNTFY